MELPTEELEFLKSLALWHEDRGHMSKIITATSQSVYVQDLDDMQIHVEAYDEWPWSYSIFNNEQDLMNWRTDEND